MGEAGRARGRIRGAEEGEPRRGAGSEGDRKKNDSGAEMMLNSYYEDYLQALARASCPAQWYSRYIFRLYHEDRSDPPRRATRRGTIAARVIRGM